MTVPSDAVACNYQGTTFFYYVCDDGTISWIQGPRQGSSEATDRKSKMLYSYPCRITYDNKDGVEVPAVANKEEPTLAVVNYERSDSNTGSIVQETRIFYIDNYLHELCELRWTGAPGSPGLKWYRGACTWKQYQPVEKSLLSAAEDGKQIKVFFQDVEGGNNISVAYADRDNDSKDAWNKRIVADKF